MPEQRAGEAAKLRDGDDVRPVRGRLSGRRRERRNETRRERREKAFEQIEKKHEVARRLAAGALHVRRAGIAAARVQNVHAATLGDDDRERNRSEKISEDERKGEKHQHWSKLNRTGRDPASA